MRNLEVGISALLEDGIQVLVYAGEEDLICNWLDAMSKMITENASEEFLHALSNYCALQGFVEDQFGLGLIARAVEEI
ncbi:methionine S-methyltransferase-like isoform X2 [Arachis hypogaea]